MLALRGLGLLVWMCAATSAQVDIDYHCPQPQCQCATLDILHANYKVQLYCEIPYLANYISFQTIQKRYTTVLTVHCSVTLFNGHIEDGAFQHLTELEELAVFDCRIDILRAETFKGLTSLKVLNIIAPKPIMFYEDVFQLAPNLQMVYFNADIQRLPHGIFCGLNNFTELDLPENSIDSLLEIGITTIDGVPCKFSQLVWINVTSNNIGSLVLPLATVAPNLQVLSLGGNDISTIDESSMQNLKHLVHLDITNNKINTLPESTLLGVESLRTLLLSHNNMACLNRTLLHDKPLLDIFTADNNALKQDCLDTVIFHYSSMLRAVDLSSNQLEIIHHDLLRNLTILQELSLDHNIVYLIEPNSLEHLHKLEILNLSHNVLTEFLNVNENMATYLPSLNTLDLSFNQLRDSSIEELHVDALPNLRELYMSDNYLRTFPTTFENLTFLEKLDLSRNNIFHIESSMFHGLDAMTTLWLRGNTISYLPKRCFTHMQELQMIDISDNAIYETDFNVFGGLNNLQTINLGNNYLTDIFLLFTDTLTLKTLLLNGNNLTTISRNDFVNSIEEIDLSSNRISYIEGFTFIGMKSLKTVRINNNYLIEIVSPVFRVSPDVTIKPNFYITTNPYVCNCRMEYLRDINDAVSGVSSQINGNIADLERVICMKCGDPRITSLNFFVDLETFYCAYDIDCIGGGSFACPCCYNLDVSCECRQICPEPCVCLHSNDRNHNEIICSQSKLTHTPTIPSQAKVIHLDGNDFTTLSSNAFLNNTAAESIYLNDGNLSQIAPGVFSNVINLIQLDLSKNNLNSLPINIFQGLIHLNSLNLKFNRLSLFDGEHLKVMPKLKMLDISNNNLQTLDLDSFGDDNITGLESLYLSNNSWSCDCDFGLTFQRWLTANADVIQDVNDVICTYVDERIIMNETNSVLDANFDSCRPLDSRTIVKMSRPLLIVTIAMAVVFVAIVTLTICIYTKRHLIQIWLYSRFGVRIYRHKEDTSRRYDAFISYSNKDQNIVVQELLPKLEEGNPPYTLCVHFRDWLIGGGIAESVIDSVNASRRTILLLSKNFIESEWCNYEFKTAHHRMLKDKSCHLIVVLLDDEPPQGLDKELQLYITTHTYIRYSDPWFWSRLRYALPDVTDKQNAERVHNKQQEKDMILEQRKFLDERRKIREFEDEQELSRV